VISEAIKLIFPVLSDVFDITHLKKSEHYERNVLEYHSVEIKGSDGYPMECPQNILASDFGGSKLGH